LNENCPASQNKAIRICFTEVTEIDEENADVTSENMKELITLAKQTEKPITKISVPLSEEKIFEHVYLDLNEEMKNDVISLLKNHDKEHEQEAIILKENA